MKQLLCAVAAIALIVPVAAAAQPRHGGHEHHQGQGHRGGHENHGRSMDRHHGRADRARSYRHESRPAYRSRGDRHVYRIGHRPATFHRIRVRAFHYPRGYSYRRWAVGAVLPRLFLSNGYYWTDWRALGLLPPPPAYVWVRYGPDLLLVNRFTGRIADVIYGAFYW